MSRLVKCVAVNRGYQAVNGAPVPPLRVGQVYTIDTATLADDLLTGGKLLPLCLVPVSDGSAARRTAYWASVGGEDRDMNKSTRPSGSGERGLALTAVVVPA